MEETFFVAGGSETVREPCAECPWRVSNHGRRHPGGFYRAGNLRRLWNQIRRGGNLQGCHPTDASHPDHRQYAGAKPEAAPAECAGSVILITREIVRAARLGGNETLELTVDGADKYLAESRTRKGLTLEGLLYQLLARRMPRPMGPGTPLPGVPRRLLESDEFGRPASCGQEPPRVRDARSEESNG